jgi:hypothetical protein
MRGNELLSSFTASVTIKLFGFFFFFKMAVATSSALFPQISIQELELQPLINRGEQVDSHIFWRSTG